MILHNILNDLTLKTVYTLILCFKKYGFVMNLQNILKDLNLKTVYTVFDLCVKKYGKEAALGEALTARRHEVLLR